MDTALDLGVPSRTARAVPDRARTAAAPRSLPAALAGHWPEYLAEAFGLGWFMVSACAAAILLEHPASPVHQALWAAPMMRRMLMGLAMGATAAAMAYSPWGRRSGAHLNPAVTLAFFRLGRVAPWDAALYPLAQVAGGIAGVAVATAVAASAVGSPQVNHVATVPGAAGPLAAFAGEVVISFVLMSVVLYASGQQRLAPYTGLFAGGCVALFIAVEAPVSGMSMNPARSLSSAVFAGTLDVIWVYLTAPPLGMLAAALVYCRVRGGRDAGCAKLDHRKARRCIFCEYRRGAQ